MHAVARSSAASRASPVEASAVPFLDVRGVSLTYGGERENLLALEGFDLAVAQGRFVSIVGPSGCGKSTLLKLVSGLRPPSAGSVFVGGQRVDRPISNVGIAFQNAALMPWRTCLQNVMLPFEVAPRHRGKRRGARADQHARALDILDRVGLRDAASRLPAELSGGMQQRTALCRALVHDPEILLLDEPFSALDALTREDLWDVLQDIHDRGCLTTVMVTHDLTEAAYLADDVYVLSARPGRVAATVHVPLPRPRRFEDRFTPAFAELVLRLRHLIGSAEKR